MSDDVALYEVDGHVAVISMNRPDKRNALSAELKEKLIELFKRAEDDDDVAVVVLRGNGKSFCAGADISPNPAKKEYKVDQLGENAVAEITIPRREPILEEDASQVSTAE
ncbi:MAG: enoyl-CoA hydratase-related protein [Proteobacteria bacterium]|nr:enoyl-CoA hydratase-related protein [Pseudomonadota bacterium]